MERAIEPSNGGPGARFRSAEAPISAHRWRFAA